MIIFAMAAVVFVIAVLFLAASIKVIPEGEQAYIIRLGRRLPEPKGPGLIIAFPPMDRVVRIKQGQQEVAHEPPAPIVPR